MKALRAHLPKGTVLKGAVRPGILWKRIHSFCGLQVVWLGSHNHLKDEETGNLRG